MPKRPAAVLIGLVALFSCVDLSAASDVQNVVLRRYALGSVTGDGWLKEDLGRLAKGMGGWNQDAIDPFWKKTASDWESEFLCKSLLGQVLLGWTSGDADIRSRATSNINRIVSPPFNQADGYLGFAKPDIRSQDYLGWPANQEIRALLLFFEANPSRTDVRDAARDYALWFTKNWNRKVYADKANGYQLPTGHGYVGLCVVDAVLEVFKHYPQEKALLDWAKDYQDWTNTSSVYGHTKVDEMRRADYFPHTHAGTIGLTAKVPGLLSCYDPSLDTYREATVNGLRRILDVAATPAGGIDDKEETLTRFDSPDGDMEYCNFQCYQEDLLVAGAMTGRATWFDDVEKMIYNAAKGATRKDWTASAYFSRVNQYASEGAGQEYKWRHYPPCCTHSAVISLPLFVSNMMMNDRDGNVFLTVYGPCRLHTDGSLLVTETTNYPFDKTVTLTFARPFDKAVGVKIPRWCDVREVVVRVNGTPQTVEPSAAGFAMVRKTGGFAAGDTITIVFGAMDRVAVKRHPQLPNQLWIERGPLVFVCEVPTIWKQYPLNAHFGYTLSAEAGAAERVKGYSVDCSDAMLKDTAQVLTSDPSGFVWDSPPVRIRIPVKSSVEYGAKETVDLVPYGCTALRKTCFSTTASALPNQRSNKSNKDSADE
jgi:hypothetical protein